MSTKILKTLASSLSDDVYKVAIDWNDAEQIENKPDFKTVCGESIFGEGDIDPYSVKKTDISGSLIKSTCLFNTDGSYVVKDTNTAYYFEAQPGAKYNITSVGEKNRFQIVGANSIPSSSASGTGVLIYSEMTSTNYAFINDKNYKYILVGLVYDDVTKSPQLTVIETIDKSLKVVQTLGYNERATLSQAAITRMYNGEEMSVDISDNLVKSKFLPNQGVFQQFPNSTSYYFKAEPNATYNINVNSEKNRFQLCGVMTKPAANVAYTVIANDATVLDYTFTNDASYEYILIGLVYEDTTLLPELSVSTTLQKSDTSIELAQKLGYSETTALSQAVITRMYCGESMNVDISDSLVEVGFLVNAGKYTTYANSKSCYFKATPGITYHLKVNGTSNRFQLCGEMTVPVSGATANVIISDNTMKEYTFTNSDGYEYILVGLVYNDAALVPDLTVTEIFNKEEDEQISLPIYVSKADIGADVNKTNMVYALYDELMVKHPDYITTSVLGHNSLDQEIREYVFTSGDYNDCTPRRSKDDITKKPVILIISGVHGYERADVLSTYKFFADMCNRNPALMYLRENYKFKLIPIVTPGAYDNNSRTNENGVNINRNFTVNWSNNGTLEPGAQDYPGEAAADQLETQIVEAWIVENSTADLFIDHHNSGFIDEVAYLAGDNKLENMNKLKETFLKAMYECRAYWQGTLGFESSNIYGYTGNFGAMASSQCFAQTQGLLATCLETSWEQNGTARHCAITNKVGAEALGNWLRAYLGK